MPWSEIFHNYLNLEPGIWEVVLRLACAMVVGLVIGTEREYTHRPAGMRTHILVALGACTVSILGEYIFMHYSSSADPARLSAQVVTGVGFLGAGTIMREGVNVKGLTTAASVWAVACLGIAAGFGHYALTVAGMVMILLTLTVFEWLQDKMFQGQMHKKYYIVETADLAATLTLVNETASVEQGSVTGFSAEAAAQGHRISFWASFGGRHRKQHQQRFFTAIAEAEHTLSLHTGDEAVQTKA
ncbi:MAG: MgtC/SapB family protein [Oscillospiraceae bacterium]|nr:MgtC/SapB family protein [Oscillospiraceae bacterium]